MADQERQIEELATEAVNRNYSRRDVIRRGIALGLTVPAIKAVLASGAFAQDATPSPAAGGPVHVSIVDKDMTFDDIKAAIAAEKEVNVGNWTYSANPQLIEQFQKYVKTVYDEDITLNYVGSQTPTTYLTDLYTAVDSGQESPYDVLAIEENYWAEVQARSTEQSTKLMEDFLPSGLIPNAERVLENLQHVPTSIGFQASATPGINYNKDNVDFLTDWKDLADPRLKGKLLMWLPGDITGGGFLLGLAASLGKDYHDLDQMKEVIDYAVDQIGVNALKYTNQNSDIQGLMESKAVDAVIFWNGQARYEYFNGHTEWAFLVAASGQYAVNGYMWIPVKPKHPILAQIFVDWRLGNDAQFPDLDTWGITKGAWSELHEGFLGPSYVDLVPDWIAADYFTYFPTIDQLSTNYKAVDWDVYAANKDAWIEYWNERLGL
jgi:hypothetical protein